MRRGTGRAAHAAGFGAKQFAALAALALALAGCASDAAPMLVQAQLRGPTIAFESIDGPPLPIFQKLVANLSAEAAQRQILVVSRAGQPAYRVRGYLAALMSQGKTVPLACKDAGIVDQTYYRWRREYGGLQLEQAKKLKDLQKENAQLKRALATLTLEKQVLKDIAEGNF